MVDREKLIELQEKWFSYDDRADLEKFAEFLIANGVVVQQWVSVKDRLPDISAENNTVQVTECVIAWDGTGYLFGCFKIWIYDGSYVFIGVTDDEMDIAAYDTVTHWMPLPEPPEGE